MSNTDRTSAQSTLPPEVIAALHGIVTHTWADVKADYYQRDPAHRAGHIFLSLTTIDDWLASINARITTGDDAPEPVDTDPSAPGARLLVLAEELGLDPCDLYDCVHDLASNPASDINNGGLDAQIPYLIDQLGDAGTEQVIRDAAARVHADRS